MPRRQQIDQDDALFGTGTNPLGRRRTIGRVERRVAAAVRKAKAEGVIDDLSDPLAVAALSLAQAMDHASTAKPDPYAVAAASRELRAVLAELQMTSPAPTGPQLPDLDALLGGLGTPVVTSS